MLAADNLLAKLSDLDVRTLRLLDTAELSGDVRTALAAIRESRGNIEAFARIGPLSDLEQRIAVLEQQQPSQMHTTTSVRPFGASDTSDAVALVEE